MKWLKRLLLDNWWLKLLSLLLAYGLWSVVTQAPPVEIRVSAPLELRFAPAGLEVRGEVPERVRLHLRGPETRLRTLQPEEVAVFINLNTATAGHYRFVLDARNAEVPPGVEVVSFVPSEVELDLVPH